ncbi:helix-turn-helix domain-containing protein [Microbacterium ulmi]|uniref:Helix-turn-helix domain-containing protein n=1 Tax=Microbacterium ulmi TaxID=179095 RepID=A0A7Y2Q0Y8_9MICO|nr:helix-turn-helix domain-containing protein [Microbacterium ulmi]NII70051.1 AraC-like DNA-binding protein [Microbacterium ulmi]NNH04853.1 helix-turn-helix domain-containing protein [Microbacterium ulmi]
MPETVRLPTLDGVIDRRSVLDTRPLKDGERFDAWTDAVNSSFVPLVAESSDIDARRRFTGAIVSQPLGRAAVSTVAGTAVTVSRSRRQIAKADPGHIKLGLQLEGYSVIAQDGRDAALAPGDFALYDTTRPYRLDFDGAFRQFVVMFPLDALRLERGQFASLTAVRFSGRQGIGALASSLLGAMSRQLDDGALGGELPLSDAVFDLLTAAIADRLGPGVADEQVRRRALRARIESFMADRIGDPQLTVAQIADAHHVSVRYLQKLFEEQNETVSGWIRHRRLEESRRQLGAVVAVATPISSVAAQWGFADAAAFARAFRQEYGVTPSEYRASNAHSAH